MSKNSKTRQCPALGRDIAVPECGAQRNSAITCPADCPHDPFSLAPGNYERSLELEDRINDLSLERLLAETADKSAHHSQRAAAHRSGPHAENAFLIWRLHFEHDAAGATFSQRWDRAGWPGIKNDERIFLRAKMLMRPALVEVHRVFPGGLAEAVDLLSDNLDNPAPLLFRENTMTRSVVRFTTLLTWIYPMPHYWRMSGTASEVPIDMAMLPAGEVVREIISHLGGPRDGEPMRRWLAQNFQRVDDALFAARQARHIQTFEALDAQSSQSVYELLDTPARCIAHLDALPQLEKDALTSDEKQNGCIAARDWLDARDHYDNPADSTSAEVGGKVLLGRVLVGEKRCVLETIGARKLARLRAQFETHMAGRVRFTAERVDDVAKRHALKTPAPDMTLVPPRLLENPTELSFTTARVDAPRGDAAARAFERKILEASERVFLDDKLPVLDNRTPREAAADPALRAKLALLVKRRVNDTDLRNLKKGTARDIDWLPAELGMTELLFEAPPRRPIPKELLAGDDHDDGDTIDTGDTGDTIDGIDGIDSIDGIAPAPAPRPPRRFQSI